MAERTGSIKTCLDDLTTHLGFSPSMDDEHFLQYYKDLLVYLSMQDVLDRMEVAELVWQLEEVTYGSWEEGPNGDSTWSKTLQLDVPESVQKNGSWWLHVFVRKSGVSVDPLDEDHVPEAIVYQKKLLTKYLKRRVHSTVNLLTGQSAINTTEANADKDAPVEIISYWHPNLTLNLVADQTPWTQGTIPPPMDQFLVFDNSSDGYYPILYINDYWNLAQDYMPINDTTRTLDLSLLFHPISLFKFQMYAAMTTKSQWADFFGSTETSDEDQDTLKQTMMETNPYLLGLTVVVTIVHSVFEFLAFKNDIQFWRTRESLAGLSVRSVFFNVFQSLIVLLYILDSETNFVIIISCFIGLLIEIWKITKVCKVSLNTENRFLGVFPRITVSDQPSYVESSTKEYDRLAFKYLGWVLFPLFICYGVYSLLYQEHKGWYSFVLGMCYGFLLTFGFITMTPQLFINYKLKSVAHLPWRMLTYKALNTFIDDMFAFVIKMPMMYRIGCFRDDIVFFIFLYQRWIYRVDPRRVNEFGTSGDGVAAKPRQEPLEAATSTESPKDGDTEPTSGREEDMYPTASPRVGEDMKGGGAVRRRTTGTNRS